MESAEKFIERKCDDFNGKQNKFWARDIGRKGRHRYQREHWTFMSQSNIGEKLFLMERLKRIEIEGEIAHPVKIGDIEYRIGYYIVAKNGKKSGKWAWGQYCPLIPQADLNKLIDKAKNEGTIK